MKNDPFFQMAVAEARAGVAEGGIPIGASIARAGELIGRGRNLRVQSGDPILHGEMSALKNAGRQPARAYRESVLYTTLSPCPMCAGAIVLYKIPKVVIGENITFRGAEEWLKSNGVELVVLQDEECIEMMKSFISAKPELWFEDIGEQPRA